MYSVTQTKPSDSPIQKHNNTGLCDRAPAAAEASAAGAPFLFVLLFPAAEPPTGRTGNPLHVGLLGVLLKF